MGLTSGTPKSWPPNSGCGGLGSEDQKEVIQRPNCPSPCTWANGWPQKQGPRKAGPPRAGGNFHYGVKVHAKQCPPFHKLRAPPEPRPPKRPRLTHGAQPIPRPHSCSFACPFPLAASVKIRTSVPGTRGGAWGEVVGGLGWALGGQAGARGRALRGVGWGCAGLSGGRARGAGGGRALGGRALASERADSGAANLWITCPRLKWGHKMATCHMGRALVIVHALPFPLKLR